MTKTIPSDNVSLRVSEPSSPELRAVAVYGTDGSVRFLSRPVSEQSVNTKSCPVYSVEAIHASEVSREAFSSFDQLLESLEQDEAASAQLSDGRKWVASTFYESQTLSGLRLAAGMSQKQLGEACGIEQPHVSRYESGKHEPSLSVSVSLARALGVDLSIFAEAWANTRQALQGGE